MPNLDASRSPSRHATFQRAIAPLAQSLGAPTTGAAPGKAVLTFLKMDSPIFSVEVPPEVARILSMPGSLRFLKLEDASGKASTTFQATKLPSPPPR